MNRRAAESIMWDQDQIEAQELDRLRDEEKDFAEFKVPDFSGNERAASAAMSNSSGSKTDIAGDAAMTYGASSGNGVAVGVGAALKVLSLHSKRKTEKENAKYLAKQDRIQKQQQSISRMVEISNGLRRL